jgi:hypothetical protein
MAEDQKYEVRPVIGDDNYALGVLREVQEVLKKRGYLLTHRQDAMLIVKVESEALMVGRAVAYVKQINPQLVEWKAIDWRGDFEKRPVS